MSYKTLCVVVSDTKADAPALIAAAEIAEREKAHLDVHCIGVDPARYEAMPVGAAAIVLQSGAQEAMEHANELVIWAEEMLAPYSASSVVMPAVVTTLGLETTVARLSRYSDLVVATKPYGDAATRLQVLIVEAVLFGSGAPVLVVPHGSRDYSQRFKRSLIAWNESDEGLEAVRKALPALKQVQATDIVMVDPPSHSPERSDPGGNICLMLARHGVASEVSILSRTLPHVSDVLLRFAHEHGSDLLVVGAYGHSRFREAVLGGATREMLEACDIPILMAH